MNTALTNRCEQTAGDLREAAVQMLERADALGGPGPIDLTTRKPEPLGTQRLVTRNIRRIIKTCITGQNELAISAGYGPDELSSFMTGRRHMELADVDRIAAALRVHPGQLFVNDAEEV